MAGTPEGKLLEALTEVAAFENGFAKMHVSIVTIPVSGGPALVEDVGMVNKSEANRISQERARNPKSRFHMVKTVPDEKIPEKDGDK